MTTTTSNGVTTTRMFTQDTPDGYHVGNGTLKYLIMDAYNVKWDSIVGGPDWIGATGYDIDAKVTPAADAPPPRLTGAQRRQMIQSLLADRFKLVVHNETKDAPIYDLELAKGGSKLPITTPNDTFAKGINGLDGNPVSSGYPVMLGRGHLFGQAVTIASLIDYLKQELHRPVVDKTGLTGKYDLSLVWTPDNTPDDSPLAGGPSLFTAIQEQLGLKLILHPRPRQNPRHRPRRAPLAKLAAPRTISVLPANPRCARQSTPCTASASPHSFSSQLPSPPPRRPSPVPA